MNYIKKKRCKEIQVSTDLLIKAVNLLDKDNAVSVSIVTSPSGNNNCLRIQDLLTNEMVVVAERKVYSKRSKELLKEGDDS